MTSLLAATWAGAAEPTPGTLIIKVCQGNRSTNGSENISIFSSLTQTAKLQGQSILDLLHQLPSAEASWAGGC